jgi:hypothetical protein
MRLATKIDLRSRRAVIVAGLVAGAMLTVPSGAFAAAPFFKSGNDGYSGPSEGSATKVREGHHGSGALLTSVSGAADQAGYGLVGVKGGNATAKTFGALSEVETQFNVTQGICAGGAPRWAIDLASPTKPKQSQFLIVYFDNSHQPYGGCESGLQQETNIIDNPATGWFVGNADSASTYSEVLASYGSWKLVDIEVIVDAGWAQTGQPNPNVQQVLLQNLKVNSSTFFVP